MSNTNIRAWNDYSLPLSNDRNDYLAFFDDSDEAFIATGKMCWQLFHARRREPKYATEAELRDPTYPFECSKEDKLNISLWFHHAYQVNSYSGDCTNLYADVFYPNVDPRHMPESQHCPKCKAKSCIPIPRGLSVPALSRGFSRVCIVCLECV